MRSRSSSRSRRCALGGLLRSEAARRRAPLRFAVPRPLLHPSWQRPPGAPAALAVAAELEFPAAGRKMRFSICRGIAAALLLTACGDDRQRQPAPPAAASATPSPVADSSVPERDGDLSESFEAPAVPFADYPDEVLECGGDVSKPVRLFSPLPVFPAERRGLAFPGVVVAQGIVDKNGDIARLRIDRSFHPSFDASVMTAVRQWKFKPADLRGRPVDVYYRLTVNFVLAQRPAA